MFDNLEFVLAAMVGFWAGIAMIVGIFAGWFIWG